MLITPHFLTGVVIATQVPEAAPAAVLAVASHYVLDAIPHKDSFDHHYLTWRNVVLVAIDGLISLALFFWLVGSGHRGYYFGIGALTMLPDLFSLPGVFWKRWWQLPVVRQLHYWHTELLQYSWPEIGWLLGLAPQLVIVGAAIYFLR